MVNNSCNPLPIKHISESTAESIQYIDGRRKGNIKCLKTPWSKYNEACGGGLEYGTIHTIAGGSGVGKTAVLNMLETDLFLLNPTEKFDVLSFNFEMHSKNLVSRKLSRLTSHSVRDIHSGSSDFVVTDGIFEELKVASKQVSNMNIFYVESAGTVTQICDTIFTMVVAVKKRYPNEERGLIITLDHTILVKGSRSDLERVILFELYTALNELKKKIKVCFVVLSQLNRGIEASERLSDPSQHFPKRSDLFAGDSCYQFSDLVTVVMNPEHLGLDSYGPHHLPVSGYLYWHIIKCREGVPGVIQMLNKLKWNTIEECTNGY